MNTPILSGQSSLELLVDSITAVVQYSVQKTKYECAQIVRQKVNELRRFSFDANAKEFGTITVQLNCYKMKLQCLKVEVEHYPADRREVWQPLIDALEQKVASIRNQRNSHV